MHSLVRMTGPRYRRSSDSPIATDLGGYSLQHGGALTPYYNAKKVKLIFNYSPYWLRSKQDCQVVNFLVFNFGLPAFARYRFVDVRSSK